MTQDRSLPHNIDAERSVLGVVIVHNPALYEVAGLLTAEDFYPPRHQRIFAAMTRLLERGVVIDFVTLKNELGKSGELEEVGGAAYVASLADGMPASANVEYYAKIVREKSILRQLIFAANKVLSSAYEASDDPSVLLDEAERALLSVSHNSDAGDLMFAEHLLPETMAMLARIFDTKRPVTGVPTGFAELDTFTRGWQPGNLVVLGGRPGEGKSALALQVALHAAQSGPVAFFSMEMSREEILTRALAQVARIDHHMMMQGRLSQDDQRKVGEAQQAIAALPITFDDTAALTPFQIRSKAKKLQGRKGLGFVVVDYLQLLQRPRSAHSREEAVADNAWALKVLAGELKVPVLALSQLSRLSTKEDRRPTMADLRESGAIEQHANVILLIYKPNAETNGVVTETPAVELIIAKQRNGPRGVHVDLAFRGPSMRFEPIEWRHA